MGNAAGSVGGLSRSPPSQKLSCAIFQSEAPSRFLLCPGREACSKVLFAPAGVIQTRGCSIKTNKKQALWYHCAALQLVQEVSAALAKCRFLGGVGHGRAGQMDGCWHCPLRWPELAKFLLERDSAAPGKWQGVKRHGGVGDRGGSMGGVSFFNRDLNPIQSREPLAASSGCGLPAEHPGQGQVLPCPSAGGHFGTWMGLRS